MQQISVNELPMELQFLSDSQDVKHIQNYIGETAMEYDSFFVRVQDGDYIEVWGISGIIPFESKFATRLI